MLLVYYVFSVGDPILRQTARVDYLGFEIPDVWVVGYGLDYADRHRTLPFIAELKRDVYQD
jgi:hypoxanthine-guanine phosphoribosyltransferase